MNEKDIKKLKAKSKRYSVNCGESLYLRVSSTGVNFLEYSLLIKLLIELLFPLMNFISSLLSLKKNLNGSIVTYSSQSILCLDL